ncbi:MAG: carbon storage regulator CsrA [Thiotrichales bacterium]|nr:carbon storage regulator CsrA [Thiotrichales bacterium]
MLVLTRRENETLVIGDDIKLTILSVKGSQVRIGIDAPKSVSIQRSELLEESANESDEPISGVNN